jgi:hypothetical protein
MGWAGLAQSTATQTVEDGSVGSLAGKLTDLYSKPLADVSLVLRNQATGAEWRAVTGKNGSYLFSGLAPGEYTLMAESKQLGRGQIEDIVVEAGHEAQVQTAMNFEPLPANPVLDAERSVEAPKPIQPTPAQPALHPSSPPASAAALPVEPLQSHPLPSQPVSSAEISARQMKIAPVVQPLQPPAPAAKSALQPMQPAPMVATPTPAAPAPALSAIVPPPSPTAPAIAAAATPPAGKPLPVEAQQNNPVSDAVTTTLSAHELQALPVSGRHWQDFVLDNTPGSVTPAGGQAQISLRGVGQPVEISVDGFGRGLAFGPTGGTNESGHGSSGRGELGQSGEGPSGMAQIGPGGHGLTFNEAAIREVQTVAGNVEAAEAKASGGRMNVETQSGGNKLHGQGFITDRGRVLSAQNPFSQWVTETTPAVLTFNPSGPPLSVPVFDNGPNGTPEHYTPTDRETVWGVGLGSQIRRNKLFWFAAADSFQRNDPGVSMVKHPYLEAPQSGCEPSSPCPPKITGLFAQPTNDQMQVLSARLGLSSANPVVEGLTAYSTMLETMDGLLGPAPRTSQQWTGFGRLDWQAAERHHFTIEGIGSRWNSPGGGLTRASENYGNHSFGSTKASEESLLGRWETFLTPNLLLTTQVSAGEAIQESKPSTPSTFERSFLTGNSWGQLPEIVVDNRYGFTIGNPSRFGKGSYPDERLYQGRESLDWIHGKLLVKAGFEVSHNTDATSLLRNQTGTYTYSNVENFISDALVFQAFGLTDALDPLNQHNCDETGKVWRDSGNTLRGLGYLPCYTSYSQTIGPSDWRLSTNDWAGYATAQWQKGKHLVLSAGLRWEREQLPPPIDALNNPELPLTERLPALGNNWAPRLGLAIGSGEKRGPVLRLGYGMYFGRTTNATVETALTQTGSATGDLNFFMRPTDDEQYLAGGSPPFPHVLNGEPGSMVKPGAVEFAPNFHIAEIHQAIVSVEEKLPSHIELTSSAMMSLGRRLPISIDTNLDLPTSQQTITYNVVDATGAGPIKASQITVPFYASWPTPTGLAGRLNPDYQQITNIESRANSTYEAAMLKLVRHGSRGLSFDVHYTYAHAMDWNPNESSQVAGNDVLAPANFGLEYGTSNLDIRHSAGIRVIYEAPWKLRGTAGKLGNGWMVAGVGQFHSGLPYTMRTSGSLAEEFDTNTGAAIVGLGPGINGSGGDNRVYGSGNNIVYNIGRNTYRYPATWKGDLRLGKRFYLGDMRQLEVLAESFNLFNHQNVTELETTGYTIQAGSPTSLPTLNFLAGPVVNEYGTVEKANSTGFGQPLNINGADFFRQRQIQLGLRFRF